MSSALVCVLFIWSVVEPEAKRMNVFGFSFILFCLLNAEEVFYPLKSVFAPLEDILHLLRST